MGTEKRTTADAVVIGGGFAGVTAARELAGAGLSTVLLEARDRLGGRTWTVDFGADRVELGGAWVHWKQPHIWAELTRYGIGIEEDDTAYEAVLFGNPPRRHEPDAAFARLRELAAEYAGLHRDALPHPHDPLRHSAGIAELDRMSMGQRLAQLRLSPEDRDRLSGLLYEVAGSPLEEAGLLGILRWLALCDWDVNAWYDTNRYRPVGGTAAVLDAMTAGSSAEVRLSSPVSAVDSRPDGVAVTTADGRVISARAAVVAVPVNVWPSIDFTPGLPPGHALAARTGMGKPHQDKVWIKVRGDIGNIFAQLPAGLPLNFFWTFRQYPDGQLIIGINANPELDVNDPDRVAEVLRSYVPEIKEVTAVLGHNWAADPYARGGNTNHRPGQVTAHLRDLQQPWGRLAFATADLASGWMGYIDGAVESGLRAARNCRAVIGS
ncbi:flavin monoamine oxidase family protein [Streptomyces sp. NPDC055078]